MRREVPVGKSRLDFVLSFDPQGQSSAESPEDSQKLYLEVKACTLIAEQTAMFPDAPTLRGLKHLEELEALAAEASSQSEGAGSGVLFVLMNPDARRFVPNLHTDPAFTRKLISLKDRIWMRAVSIRTEEDGTARLANPDVPIDLGAASAVVDDRGVYLLVVELKRRCRFPVGTLGEIQFEAAWYVYVGSGKKNLHARIARHHRRRKKMHWHIDYLLARVDPGYVTSLAIRSEHDLECRLARDVAGIAAASTNGFGCSDCSCRSHLFRFDNNPLHSRGFLDLLLHYRHSAALT
jgi:sugar fermentation stimulation protein A